MRALQSNVKANVDEDFLTADNVYCKRQNYKGWCGPVKVLGKQSQCVLISLRGTFYRMQPCYMMKINNKKQETKNWEPQRKNIKIYQMR